MRATLPSHTNAHMNTHEHTHEHTHRHTHTHTHTHMNTHTHEHTHTHTHEHTHMHTQTHTRTHTHTCAPTWMFRKATKRRCLAAPAHAGWMGDSVAVAAAGWYRSVPYSRCRTGRKKGWKVSKANASPPCTAASLPPVCETHCTSVMPSTVALASSAANSSPLTYLATEAAKVASAVVGRARAGVGEGEGAGSAAVLADTSSLLGCSAGVSAALSAAGAGCLVASQIITRHSMHDGSTCGKRSCPGEARTV
jgi:hypothetical protein